MRKLLRKIKNKKGFTLMEVVVALAIVGIVSSMILPLTTGAMASFRASQSLRDTAASASQKMSTTQHKNNDSSLAQTLYVTISYNDIDVKNTESKLIFYKSTAKGDYDVNVTYYELDQKNVEK